MPRQQAIGGAAGQSQPPWAQRPVVHLRRRGGAHLRRGERGVALSVRHVGVEPLPPAAAPSAWRVPPGRAGLASGAQLGVLPRAVPVGLARAGSRCLAPEQAAKSRRGRLCCPAITLFSKKNWSSRLLRRARSGQL